eukprot:357881-Chlamydomonas_euryale.AAC.19
MAKVQRGRALARRHGAASCCALSSFTYACGARCVLQLLGSDDVWLLGRRWQRLHDHRADNYFCAVHDVAAISCARRRTHQHDQILPGILWHDNLPLLLPAQ